MWTCLIAEWYKRFCGISKTDKAQIKRVARHNEAVEKPEYTRYVFFQCNRSIPMRLMTPAYTVYVPFICCFCYSRDLMTYFGPISQRMWAFSCSTWFLPCIAIIHLGAQGEQINAEMWSSKCSAPQSVPTGTKGSAANAHTARRTRNWIWN